MGIWLPVLCIDGTWMMFQICFMISLHLFLRCIVILLDKVKAFSFQLSKPTSVKHACLTGALSFGIKF